MYPAPTLTRCLTLLLCLSLPACAPKPYVDYDTAFAFQQARSYFLLPAETADDPLVAARVHAAVADELARKGLSAAAADRADLTVRVRVAAEQRPSNRRISIGLGTGSYGGRASTSVGGAVSAPLGADTLVFNNVQIDMFAGASDKLVWRGSDAFEAKGTPENRAESARRLVQSLLTHFPPANP